MITRTAPYSGSYSGLYVVDLAELMYSANCLHFLFVCVGPGKQGMVHGKDRCGAVFVKRLVSMAASR